MQSAMDTFCEIAIAGKDIPLGMSASQAWASFSVDIEIALSSTRAVDVDSATDDEEEEEASQEQVYRYNRCGAFEQGYGDGSRGIEFRPECIHVMDYPTELKYNKLVREFYMKGYVCKDMEYWDVFDLYYHIWNYNKSSILINL